MYFPMYPSEISFEIKTQGVGRDQEASMLCSYFTAGIAKYSPLNFL
jgi:hypothetical protein